MLLNPAVGLHCEEYKWKGSEWRWLRRRVSFCCFPQVFSGRRQAPHSFPVSGSWGLICPLGPSKSGVVTWAETHPLPVPFPVSCAEHVGCVDLCHTNIPEPGFHVEKERAAWGLGTVRPSGRALIFPGDAWEQGVSRNRLTPI